MLSAVAPVLESSSLTDFTSLLRRVRETLVAFRESPTEATEARLGALRREAASMIARIPRSAKSGPEVAAARELLSLFASWGAGDIIVPPENLELARAYHGHGWQGLLAAMVLVPAAQWPDAPRLQDVPPSLWAEYVAYVFYAPHGFSVPGQADTYARHYLRRLEELAQLGAANRGAIAIREALGVYCLIGSTSPLYCSGDSLRRQLELRTKIHELAVPAVPPLALEATSRDGRKLKLGFVQRSLDTRSAPVVAFFENLDPERFDVRLYVTQQSGTAMERHAASRAGELTVLPTAVSAQHDALIAAALDVLVFTDELSGAWSELADLASHRSAPLQLALGRAGVTTGLGQIDAIVVGADAIPAAGENDFVERVAVVPGAGFAFSAETPRSATPLPTREALGIPAGTVVFGAVADAVQITPEVRQAWVRILAAVPSSRLVVLPAKAEAENVWHWNRLDVQFATELAQAGVSGDAVSILAGCPITEVHSDLAPLMDVALAPFPAAEPVGLVSALSSGVPVVALDGSTLRARRAGAVLRGAELSDWVARDSIAYVETAVRLATGERIAARSRVDDRMARLPLFCDSLATADAFAALVEKAYDDVYLLGVEALRTTREPLRIEPDSDLGAAVEAATLHFNRQQEREAGRIAAGLLGASPTLPIARQIMGAVELRAGRVERALKYYVAAIQHDEGNPGLWYDTALALHRAGQLPPALDALRTSLRLDPSQSARQQLLNAWMGETAVPTS